MHRPEHCVGAARANPGASLSEGGRGAGDSTRCSASAADKAASGTEAGYPSNPCFVGESRIMGIIVVIAK